MFCLLIGPVFIRALRRYRRRFEVRWETAPAAAAAMAALAAVVGRAAAHTGGVHQLEGREVPAARPEPRRRLRRRAARRVQPADDRLAALGLAARHNPRDVRRRRGRAITTYLRRRAMRSRDVGEVERTILVLRAAGLSPRRFSGRNLVAEVLSRKRRDGSIAGYVSYTAFGILAFKAAGEPVGSSTIAWLEDAQKPDGGFGLTPRAGADFDMTGATLQALAAVGREEEAARGAVAYLRRGQNPDGGFPQMEEGTSNAQSTAYAVQGLRRRRRRRPGGQGPELPEAAPAPQRLDQVLERQSADAGLGDGPGADGAAAQGAAAPPGATQTQAQAPGELGRGGIRELDRPRARRAEGGGGGARDRAAEARRGDRIGRGIRGAPARERRGGRGRTVRVARGRGVHGGAGCDLRPPALATTAATRHRLRLFGTPVHCAAHGAGDPPFPRLGPGVPHARGGDPLRSLRAGRSSPHSARSRLSWG